jgi:hypothetical protein
MGIYFVVYCFFFLFNFADFFRLISQEKSGWVWVWRAKGFGPQMIEASDIKAGTQLSEAPLPLEFLLPSINF